ncbi:MAG: FG-GAP repeat domain-containing protein [Blastocatellia bacterium]
MKSKLTLSPAKFGRGMNRRSCARIVALSLTLVALLAAGLTIGLRGGQAQSSGGGQKPDPDYSQIPDYTNGRTHLLRNDDLVMTFNYRSASGATSGSLFTAGTFDSQGTFLNDRQIIPQGTPGCSTSGGCQYNYPQFVGNRPAIGRFFNTTSDTTVHYPVLLDGYPYFVSLAGKTTTTQPPSAGLTWTTAQSINFVTGGDSFLAAVGDFNQDGYDDLLMAWSNTSAFPSNPKLCVATAVDVNFPSKGFKFGPVYATVRQTGIRELAVGDFNGDRQPDIAHLSVGQGAQLDIATFAVDPATLAISEGGIAQLYTLASVAVNTALTMTPGKFTSAINQQIAVGFHIGSGQNFKVQIVDFDPQSLQPKLMTTFDVPDANNDPVLKLKAGRLDWSSPYDQIVWMSSLINAGTRLEVLTVDPASLAVTMKANYVFDGDGDPNAVVFGRDIALGNFDHMQQSTADSTQKERDPNLQIAMIGLRVNRQNGQIGTLGVAILDVSEDLSTITTASYTGLDQTFLDNQSLTEASIAAADLRGRSFRLGAGYKITVDHVQPSVVLAAPPMHADYISPGLGKLATVLNLSLAPDAFNSKYEQTESTNASATQTGTTSSSFSGEEKISGSFAIGEVGSDGDIESGVKITDSFTAKQDIKDSTDTINGAFNSQEFDISQTTGFSDVVWFKDTSFYLYVYPVIGQTVCPAGKTDPKTGKCTVDEIPMQIMFSAPKAATVQRLASDTLEWYQPPWEYGNLLSYPAGLPQLKQYLPDIELLTAETTVFATDDAAATLKTTWSNGRTTGQNIDHEELYSEDNDLSVEGKVGGEGFGFAVKASAGLDLNFGGSDGTKTLTDSETKFNSARGITITKPGTFPDPFSYKYFFSPYIFGKMKPVGYTDTINSTADLLSFGTLRSAYTANPIGTSATNAGAWWSQSDYRKFPDVALNHPNRWSYGAQGKPSNGVIPSNCVAVDNFSMDCVTPTERAPENPWRDAFHDMRGLFITNTLNPPSANALMAPGAQLETATAGDKLNLWTRVYNYSLKEMPAGAKVKVRFYGMQLDEQNLPVNNGGGSFQIGNDVVLSPIAPFNNDPKAPVNWVLASTVFDTTGRENQALGFWVVVWMEDASGKLVQELPGHGLSGIPSSTATPTFNALTALEELVDNPLKVSADDPAQVSFSNNIGFYRSAFHILAKTPSPSVAAPRLAAGSVKVEKVEVSGTALKPGRSVEGSVTLRNGAQELLGVMVYFYDGDPQAGGRLVDIERVARLRANGQQKVSINFRPQACGAHQLFVRVDPGKEHAVSGQASQAVQVDCPTPVCVAQVCMRSPQYYALNLNRLPKGMVTVTGNGVDTRVSTSDTARMRMLLQGGASRQQQLNQQFVATQLSLLGQPGGDQAALRSNLLCYKLNFQPTQLSTGAILNPSMTLGELFDQVRLTGRSGKPIDQRQLATLLHLLNGDDPQGRCR